LNETDSLSTSKPGQRIGIILLMFTTIFVAIEYFRFRENSYDSYDLVTIDVAATDIPSFIQTKQKTGYRLKAQEFNCHFWIDGVGLEIVRNNTHLQKRVQTVRRGDKLKLTILESDKENINSLYYEAHLFGLQIEDKLIYSHEDVQLYSRKEWANILVVTGTICGIIFFGLLIRLVTKTE
jgi:hypothetical protein